MSETAKMPPYITDFVVPIGVVISLIGGVITVAIWLTTLSSTVHSHEDRIVKIESHLEQSDQKITDVQQANAVQNELLKSINEKLDDLKKSLDQLQSRVMGIKG